MKSWRCALLVNARLSLFRPFQTRLNSKVHTVQIQMRLLPRLEISQRNFSSLDRESIDSQIQNISNFVLKTGKVIPHDLVLLVQELKASPELSDIQALFVLRCCGSAMVDMPKLKRQLFVDDWWQTMMDQNISLQIQHYNTLLKAYLDNGKAFSPTDIMSEIASKNLEPNHITYEYIIAKFCQVSKFDLRNCLRFDST